MKPIMKGQIYEILPLSNGIIFSYCKDILGDKVIVSYKMISFDNGGYTDVAKNIYLLTKFGTNYRAVVAYCDNYIKAKAIVLPGNRVFLLLPNGVARMLDADTSELWMGELTYRGNPPSDIALYKNTLWASYDESNVLLRFNVSTMREELRIGGNHSPFNKPRDLFVDGENVMVCNSGSHKLTQVNLNSYTVFDFEEFEEPVYQYVRVGDYRFVILESGLYLL